jgi:hypothetical protein
MIQKVEIIFYLSLAAELKFNSELKSELQFPTSDKLNIQEKVFLKLKKPSKLYQKHFKFVNINLYSYCFKNQIKSFYLWFITK